GATGELARLVAVEVVPAGLPVDRVEFDMRHAEPGRGALRECRLPRSRNADDDDPHRYRSNRARCARASAPAVSASAAFSRMRLRRSAENSSWTSATPRSNPSRYSAINPFSARRSWLIPEKNTDFPSQPGRREA